jgi:hypothetical protein
MSSGGSPASAARGLFLGLTFALVGIHLYLGLLAPLAGTPTTQFVLIGGALLLLLALYPTRYWRSVLYLVVSGLAAVLGVLWLLGGMALPTFGLFAGVVGVVLIPLGAYLFVRAGVAGTGE